MKRTLILDGMQSDIDQAVAELKSNIQYDNLSVIVSEVIEEKPRKLSRREVARLLGAHYTLKFGGKVWAAWEPEKRAYSIRGEELPAHPDLRDKYPNGWSLLGFIKPTKARELIKT